jgi:hypothetical protein
MAPTARERALDRHALVTAVWLSAGLVAATLFHTGLGGAGAGFVLASFCAVLAGFVGHVIVNAVFGTEFSVREVALGLVLYGGALVAFGLATLLDPDVRSNLFLPAGAGFALLFAAAVFYMVTRAGLRGAFESFDVIRTFRASPQRSVTSGEGGE